MTMSNAEAARESARHSNTGRFGVQPKRDPGTDIITAGLPAAQDFDGQPVHPCTVQLQLNQMVGGYQTSAGYLEFDAAPVLAGMKLADRKAQVTNDIEGLYVQAIADGLVTGWHGTVEVRNPNEVADWVEANPELQLAGDGWTEVWDEDENAIVISWEDRDAGDARADAHVARFRGEGKFVALSDNATSPELRVMPCADRSEAYTIAALNGYDESEPGDGYTDFWEYTAPDDDDLDCEDATYGQENGIIRVYEPALVAA